MGHEMSFTISDAGLAAQMFSLGSGVVGGFYSAKSQKNNLHFQADMANISARISELQSRKARAQGADKVAIRTAQAGQQKASQRAALAANGVVLNEGSAAELQATEDLIKEMDVNVIQSQALDASWGYKMQKVNYQNQALMARASASGISPLAAGLTTLLTGAGQVASSWYKVSRNWNRNDDLIFNKYMETNNWGLGVK
jgi:hypothetical protein